MPTAHLRPCSACSRHVRVSEDACPFCGAGFAGSFREAPRPRAPTGRLTRAALLALGGGTVAFGPACTSSSAGAGGTQLLDGSFVGPGDGGNGANAGDGGFDYDVGSPVLGTMYGTIPLHDAGEACGDGLFCSPPYETCAYLGTAHGVPVCCHLENDSLHCPPSGGDAGADASDGSISDASVVASDDAD